MFPSRIIRNLEIKIYWESSTFLRKTSLLVPKEYPKKEEEEEEEERKTKVSRRKEIIKIRSEINVKVMKETIGNIKKTKSWFFEKIYKIDKPLARLNKNKREKTQINRVRNEKGEVTTGNTETQRTMKDDDLS